MRSSTFATDRLPTIEEKLLALRNDLAQARIKARDEIYEKTHMVAQKSESDNVVQVDFLGLPCQRDAGKI